MAWLDLANEIAEQFGEYQTFDRREVGYRYVYRPGIAPVECKKCGDMFTPRYQGRHYYCSAKCRPIHPSRQHVDHAIRPCPKCTTLFKPRRTTQQYCSVKCRVKERITWNIPKRKCEHCGELFKPRERRQRFCYDNSKCKTRRWLLPKPTPRKPVLLPKPAPPPKLVPRPCVVCQEVFQPARERSVVCAKDKCFRVHALALKKERYQCLTDHLRKKRQSA